MSSASHKFKNIKKDSPLMSQIAYHTNLLEYEDYESMINDHFCQGLK